MHLPNPLYEFFNSVIRFPQYFLFPGRVAYLKWFARWQYDAFFGPRHAAEGPERLTVILLSYKRVRNMQPIVRSLLKADFVEKIIVSNNNPEYRIRDWIRLSDERLHLVDQPVKRGPGIRFEFARSEPGKYFISIDDDTFLSPAQLKQLFRELLARPDGPHGFQGELYVDPAKYPERKGFKIGLQCIEQQVDVLNRAYAFNREHVAEMYRLGSALGLEVGRMDNGEDILLSMSGQERPYLHDLGKVGECLSSFQKGVSTWRTRRNFFAERAELFLSLREHKSLALKAPSSTAAGR